LQSSNSQGNNPYTQLPLPSKRKWKLGATFFSLLSIAGGLAVNNHLNPPSSAQTIPLGGGTTGTGTGTGTTGTGSGKADKTVSSDPIQYQFGTVQLSVTRKSGKISAIDIGSSTASAGRDQAFPYLVQYAIKAQGVSFGDLSGATYTSEAFKQALTSAISKLG
jgi:uncharacterized protein with FMN-binding domain